MHDQAENIMKGNTEEQTGELSLEIVVESRKEITRGRFDRLFDMSQS
jgi:hypothetical protein